MDLAWISVLALAVTILVSCTTRLNPGILAIVFTWIIAAYVAPAIGQSIPLKTVLAGFPAELFLTLVGVTLLFSQAQTNGTLDLVARSTVSLCRGHAGLIPIVFFCLTAAISFFGAGSVAAAALIAPAAMASAVRAGIPPFLMVLMVGHGSIAGGMSPFAMTGIIANSLMAQMDLKDLEWQTFFSNFLANAIVAFSGYLFFGGWRLFVQHAPVAKSPDGSPEASSSLPRPEERAGDGGTQVVFVKSPNPNLSPEPCGSRREEAHSSPGERRQSLLTSAATVQGFKAPSLRSETSLPAGQGEGNACQSSGFSMPHVVTLGAIAALVVAVLVFKANVGLAAFATAAVLTVTRMADEKATFRAMPWPVILMVCGVTLLTSLLERTGGIERISDVMALGATKKTAPGVVAFATGVISVYSSTSGVVLPAFLPTVPHLVEKLGGGDALAIASSINIGGNLVDVSPLSTIGALCIACAAAGEDRRVLFNKVLAWGLSMSLAAAAICTLLFGLR